MCFYYNIDKFDDTYHNPSKQFEVTQYDGKQEVKTSMNSSII